MKLALFVHDCHFEIGHTKAMIEVLRRLPGNQLSSITIVSFKHDPVEKLFPNLNSSCKVHLKQVPLPNLKPFLIKVIFYQIYSFFYLIFNKHQFDKTISIGVCAFFCDIINVQFAHFMWEKEYFRHQDRMSLKGLYKTLLLRYLTFCEYLNYKWTRRRFVFLSQFIQKAMQNKFNIPNENCTTIYSSVDYGLFFPKEDLSREKKLESLAKQYPELNKLNFNAPISLFVGAFERKGLPRLIQSIESQKPELQLVIVGKAESHSSFSLPKKKNFVHISFSKEIQLFYDAFDCFIFPTLFEPFGLVVLEAAASGMNLLVTKKDVGASELLESLDGVAFIDDHLDLNLACQILKTEQKVNQAKKRKYIFQTHSWQQAANKWSEFINSF